MTPETKIHGLPLVTRKGERRGTWQQQCLHQRGTGWGWGDLGGHYVCPLGGPFAEKVQQDLRRSGRGCAEQTWTKQACRLLAVRPLSTSSPRFSFPRLGVCIRERRRRHPLCLSLPLSAASRSGSPCFPLAHSQRLYFLSFFFNHFNHFLAYSSMPLSTLTTLCSNH